MTDSDTPTDTLRAPTALESLRARVEARRPTADAVGHGDTDGQLITDLWTHTNQLEDLVQNMSADMIRLAADARTRTAALRAAARRTTPGNP